MAGTIRSWKFDDLMYDAALGSDDETLEFIADAAWPYYCDVRNHHCELNRHEWNLYQRLLLLLRSEASVITADHDEVDGQTEPFISGSDMAAAEAAWRAHVRRLFPYASLTEIRAVHRTVPHGFHKQRFPQPLCLDQKKTEDGPSTPEANTRGPITRFRRWLNALFPTPSQRSTSLFRRILCGPRRWDMFQIVLPSTPPVGHRVTGNMK